MNRYNISGTVTYVKLATGFWGIIGDDGQEWRPVNMPEQLKLEGRKVQVKAIEVDEGASIFMWGMPIRILSFHTLSQ
jgi:hypothetical protein